MAILKGVKHSFKPGGKLLFQCAGRKTEDDIVASGKDIIKSDKWMKYFRGFSNPYGTYGPENYHVWLALAWKSSTWKSQLRK